MRKHVFRGVHDGQIRKSRWEYALVVQELLARILESGATVSGTKIVLSTPELELLGAVVALDGAHVSHKVTAKLAKWPTCKNSADFWGRLELDYGFCKNRQTFDIVDEKDGS